MRAGNDNLKMLSFCQKDTISYPMWDGESDVLWSNFRNASFGGFTCLMPSESKNHISSSLSVGMHVYVCYQHNSKTNCSKNSKFSILHLYYVKMLHEFFTKIKQIISLERGTRKNSNTWRPKKGIFVDAFSHT